MPYRPCTLAIAAALIGGLSLTSAAPARAALVKNYEFNVDGVLPAADSQTTFFNNTGHGETTLFSVSGGLLQQRTLAVNGNASYSLPNNAVVGGGLSAADSFSIEARLRVLGIDGQGGAFFQLFDGANRFSVLFDAGEVNVLGTTGWNAIALDISEFHTYRLESLGNSAAYDFYIDGVLALSATAITYTSLNGFNFGDGITDPGFGADVDWDYLRVSQPLSEVSPVPEPAAVLVLGAGLVTLVAVRRRAVRKAV